MKPLASKLCTGTLLAAVIMLMTLCNAQTSGDSCKSEVAQRNCSDCFKQGPECVWCKDPRFTGESRCDVRSALENTCGSRQIEEKSGSRIEYKDNKELGEMDGSGKPLTIKPQELTLNFRPGTDTLELNLTYKRVREGDADIRATIFDKDADKISVHITPHCERAAPGNRCLRVQKGETITFGIKVKWHKSCDGAKRELPQRTAIRCALHDGKHYVGITNLHVHHYCEEGSTCECEKRINPQDKNSAYCNRNGDLVCGKCQCPFDFLGSSCNCSLHQIGVQTKEEMEDKCRSSPKGEICSGHGTCDCGRCKCEPNYSNTYCDCSDLDCPKVNGQLCGGPYQGRCSCGKCQCAARWSGDDCACSTDFNRCLAPNRQYCNGHGKCECGACECEDGWDGTHCEDRVGVPAPVVTIAPAEPAPEPEPTEPEQPTEPEEPNEVTEGATVKEGETGEPEPTGEDTGDKEKPKSEAAKEEAKAASAGNTVCTILVLLSVIATTVIIRSDVPL